MVKFTSNTLTGYTSQNKKTVQISDGCLVYMHLEESF